MDTLQAIYARRAIKHYDPDHELTAEEEQKLMDAAIQSRSDINKRTKSIIELEG